MNHRVFRKHILDLRASWDPKLLPNNIGHLDNTMSMYNLFDVCVFCSQFFDPDYEGGIFSPHKRSPTKKTRNTLGLKDIIAAPSHTQAVTAAEEKKYQSLMQDKGLDQGQHQHKDKGLGQHKGKGQSKGLVREVTLTPFFDDRLLPSKVIKYTPSHTPYHIHHLTHPLTHLL